MERAQSGQKGEELLDTEEVGDRWLPACTHMDTSDDNGVRAHTHTHTRAHPMQRVSGGVRCGVSAKFSLGLHEGPCLDRRVRDQRAGGVSGIFPSCKV